MSSTTNPVIETSQAATVQYQTNTETKEKSGTGATTTSTQSGTRVFIRNIPFKTTPEELKAHLITATPNVVSTEIISYSSGRSKGCGLAEFKSVTDVEKVVNTLNNSMLGGRKIFIREDREPKGYTGARRNPESTKINNTSTTTNTVPSTTSNTTATSGVPIVKSTTNTQSTTRTNNTGSNTNNGDSPTNNSDKFVQVRNTRGNRMRGSRGGFRRGNRGGRRERNYNNSSSTQRAPNNDPCNLYVGNLPYSLTNEELNDMFVEFGQVVKAVVAADPTGRPKGYATVRMDKAENAQRAIDALNDTEVDKRTISVRIDNFSPS